MMTRATDTRAQEARAANPLHEQWDDIDFEESVLLDTKNIPPLEGMVQRWVRTKIRGQDDQSNVSLRMGEGWRPRLLDTVPAGRFVPKVDFEGMGVIGKQGMILMHRPARLHGKQAAYIAGQTQDQMAAVENNLFRVHQEGSKLTRPSISHKSAVTKGRLAEPDED